MNYKALQMITAFIFDIGNVLLRFDFGVAIRKVANDCAVEPHEIFDRLVPIKDLYESGRMDRTEFLGRAAEKLGFSGSEEELLAAWRDIFAPNDAMHRLVEHLAPSYPLYLLSNTNDLHLEWILENYPVFRHFRDAVYSHVARCMKPNAEIYEVALRQFGLSASKTVFIDDLPANIAAGRDAGLHAIQYDPLRHGDLLDELRTKHSIAC